MHQLRKRNSSHFSMVPTQPTKRCIKKDGHRNLNTRNIVKNWDYFKDIVSTVLEQQWRYVIAFTMLSTAICWMVFAGAYYVISSAHGDLTIDPMTGKRLSDGKPPCITSAPSFTGHILMSVEAQTTLGFGEKYTTEECPTAIIVYMIQLIVGTIIDGAVVSIFFAKSIRPSKRTQQFKFSNKATICQRDGQMCFIFRLFDTCQRHLIKTKLNVCFVEDIVTKEGERISGKQTTIKFENFGRIFGMWPLTLAHIIDGTSPFYGISAKDLKKRKFEIVVTISGEAISTARKSQSRTSYLSREILWGQRFLNIIHYDHENERYVVDDDNFNTTEVVATPFESTKEQLESIRVAEPTNDSNLKILGQKIEGSVDVIELIPEIEDLSNSCSF